MLKTLLLLIRIQPEYTETPGVASGAIRDRKVKMGLRDEDVVPGASGPVCLPLVLCPPYF